MEDRLIGIKSILPVIEKMYGITTWKGAKKFISKRHLPLRHTQSGKPMFYTHELIKYDKKFQDVLVPPCST